MPNGKAEIPGRGSKPDSRGDFFYAMDDKSRLVFPARAREKFTRMNGLASLPPRLSLIVRPDENCILAHTEESIQKLTQALSLREESRDLINFIYLSVLDCSVDVQRGISSLSQYVKLGILNKKDLFKLVCSFHQDPKCPESGYPLRIYPVALENGKYRIADMRKRIMDNLAA
jgi:DNA-binding transcriptional regulator/RsmH inhibitor MraZ